MLLVVLPFLASCEKLDYEGWLNKPVPITLFQNIPLVDLHFDGESATPAAVDIGSPLTVVDRGGSNTRTRGELRLQDGAFPSITRFIFRNIEVYDLTLKPAGLNSSTPLRGLLGTSLLQHFALHLSYGQSPMLTFKDEIPDSNQDLAGDCDPREILLPAGSSIPPPSCFGVFSTPRLGGGLARIGDEVIDLPPTRNVLPLCFLPLPFDPRQTVDAPAITPSGISAMGVVATGLGTSVISRSALERLRTLQLPLVEKKGSTLYLPSGPEQVSIITLDSVAAVSNETIDLGPCAELARRRRLLVAENAGLQEEDKDQNGASVALISQPVEFAVFDDSRPFIQSLRQELSPLGVDVEVILGGNFLRYFEVDVDYPASRLILQCAENVPNSSCQVLPFCAYSQDPRCPTPAQP